MPGDWDKNVHPDLVEDEAAPAPDAPAAADTAEVPDSAADSGEGPSTEPQAPTEPPEWFAAVRDAKDPTEALRLLGKNMSREQIEKDEVLSGLIGQIGDRRARALQQQEAQAAHERAKLEAARSNDLYTLGELAQRELQAPLQAQQAAQAAAPFMDGVVAFQKQLPEAIQKEISGKAFGQGKTYAEGVAEYMAYVVDRAVKLEQSKRESALRKSVMSELNGDEPVPERESGTPGRVREVTDEQIANMSLREYEALFDENGRPKPGVRHRSTRGIPIRQQ